MKIINEDILKETHGIIVRGCNAQGKFGAGLAKQISRKYPQVELDYIRKYRAFSLELGDVIYTQITSDLIIASGITQLYYGRDPKCVYIDYEAIKMVFIEVNKKALTTRLPVKFPLIGCGLAQGNWEIISGIINAFLDPSIERTLFVMC